MQVRKKNVCLLLDVIVRILSRVGGVLFFVVVVVVV